jgi:hypothetical protein
MYFLLLVIDEECFDYLDQMKQTKMQNVQDTSHRNLENLNNVKREDNTNIRKKLGIFER